MKTKIKPLVGWGIVAPSGRLVPVIEPSKSGADALIWAGWAGRVERIVIVSYADAVRCGLIGKGKKK